MPDAAGMGGAHLRPCRGRGRWIHYPPSTVRCGTHRGPVRHRKPNPGPDCECMDGPGIPLWHGSSR